MQCFISSHSSSSHYSMQGFIFISFHFFFLFFFVNKWYFFTCELVLFSHFRIDVTKMLVHDDTDCIWLIWPPFSGCLKKFHISEIIYLAIPRGILESPSAVFSVCKNLYQKLVFCWHVYDRCTNCKFINWYPDVTIWILVQCTAFLIEKNLNYYHIGRHF